MAGTVTQTALNALAEICAAGATLGVLYGLTAALMVLRFNRTRPSSAGSGCPAVTILKPLHGNEPGLYSRLASFCRQNYAGAVQLVCGVQMKDDPAAGVVELLATTHAGADIDLVVDDRNHGSNRKVSNLINMQALARHEVLVISDSDIAVGPDFLSDTIAELQRSGVGGVTCAYYGAATRGLWSRISALQINSQFLPNIVMALSFGAANPCFGAAIAIRRSTLERIGGLGAVADELADDFAIGKAVRAHGEEMVVSNCIVGHVCWEPSFRRFLERQVRSARTIYSIDPIGHLGTAFTYPLPLALIADALGITHSALLILAAFLSRVVVCSSVRRIFGLARQDYWLIPLHDLISFAVFVWSFSGSSVVWRGYGYHFTPDHEMRRD